MSYITKNQTYVVLLVVVFATVMITGTIASSADNSVFAKKHKGSKKGNHQNIGLSDHISQKAICITAGGSSPISESCNNTADSKMDNSGGNAGGSGHGSQKIGLHGHHQQIAKCITAGGDSPISGSCTNSFKSANGNSGGNVGLAFD